MTFWFFYVHHCSFFPLTFCYAVRVDTHTHTHTHSYLCEEKIKSFLSDCGVFEYVWWPLGFLLVKPGAAQRHTTSEHTVCHRYLSLCPCVFVCVCVCVCVCVHLRKQVSCWGLPNKQPGGTFLNRSACLCVSDRKPSGPSKACEWVFYWDKKTVLNSGILF